MRAHRVVTAATTAAFIASLVGLIPGATAPAVAATNTLTPTAFTREAGVATGGISELQTIDGASVHLGPGVSRSYRSYQLGAGVAPASVWSFAVKANVRGPVRTQQVWSWFLRDFSTNKWVLLGDNAEAVAQNVPITLRFYPAGPFTRYVSAAGVLQVRTVSANKPLATDLDAEWIELETGTPPSFVGWVPPVGTRWQYQLQPPVDTTVTAVPWSGGAAVHPDVFDIDLYGADGVTPAASDVAQIHTQGAHAICYVDAGTYENWRPDASVYPKAVLGANNGWPGERWIDIRRLDVLIPIIGARVQSCLTAGFDAVEFDNMDAAYNVSGFKVTKAQQVEFNRAMAAVAHFYGLAVGLKNDVAQLTQLQPYFEFAINEQCSQYSECSGYDAWTSAGKAVAQVEYTALPAAFCPPAIAAGRSAIKKDLALHATPYLPCN